MKRIGDTLLILAVTFVATILLNGVLQYLLRDSGSVRIGPDIPTSEQVLVPVEVENFSNNVIDNLQLSVPFTSSVDEFVTSAPLTVDVLSSAISDQPTKVLSISGIEPRTTTIMLIPAESSDAADLIRPINARELGLSTEEATEVLNPVVAAAVDALTIAIVYSIFMGAYTYWTYGENAKLKQTMEGIEDKQARAEAMVFEISDDSERREKEAKQRFLKLKVLLMARLDDYSRELRFWRDTVRALLLKVGSEDSTQKLVIETVTQQLKTFTTLESGVENDFQTIFVLAGLLADGGDKAEE